MKLPLAIAAAALLACCGASAQEQLAPVANPPAGPLVGAQANGVDSFKAIPYAQPPVGPLRWAPPRPMAAWTVERPADAAGPVCMQVYDKTDNGVGPLPMSEDCLTLNVFAPAKGVGRDKAAPVMVWIHGGGFINGSGTAALYDGSALARQGVVVVTLNYRLGPLGFFALPALSKEQAGGLTANYGLMDQIAALGWVKRNIAAFGGDPGNVTIFGESAGGASVNRLMLAPQARGLFHKAISQSGLGSEQPRLLDKPGPAGEPSAQDDGLAIAARTGLAPGDLAALRALPADKVMAAAQVSFTSNFFPIQDGKLVTGRVDAGFAAGRQAHVPFIVGTNGLEFFWAKASNLGAMKALVPWPPDTLARIKAAYGDDAAYDADLVSDATFTEPARFLARAQAAAGAPTWLYRFEVLSAKAPKGTVPTPHAQERQYVFRTLATSPWPTTANDEAQAAAISAYWVAFARTGDPNGGGRPIWSAVAPGQDRLLDFANDGPKAGTPGPAAVLDVIGKEQAPHRAAP